jgi:hypothetical protein
MAPVLMLMLALPLEQQLVLLVLVGPGHHVAAPQARVCV